MSINQHFIVLERSLNYLNGFNEIEREKCLDKGLRECCFCQITEDPDRYGSDPTAEKRCLYYKIDLVSIMTECPTCLQYLDSVCLYCKTDISQHNQCNCIDNAIFDNKVCTECCVYNQCSKDYTYEENNAMNDD